MVAQSLPGPLAIQVGIYVSHLRGGFWGAWVGGWSFILPNFVIVAALGALYVHLGDLKPVTAIFYGVSPAVIALILHSCYRLARLGMEDRLQWALAACCFVVTLWLQAEVAWLFLGAGALGAVYYGGRLGSPSANAAAVFLPSTATGPQWTLLGKILAFFLKAGSLTFGSGLVIVPFLEQGVVREHGWLDERAFLVAAAIGTILGASVLLGRIAIGDPFTVMIGAASLLVLFRWKISNPLLVAVAAALGCAAYSMIQPTWVMVR